MTYLDPFMGPQTGSLYITNYKMYFKSTSSEEKSDEAYILNVPLGVISHVEKIGRSRSRGENAYGLEVYCKVKELDSFICKEETTCS